MNILQSEKLIRQSFLSNDFTFHYASVLLNRHFRAVDYVENTSHSHAIDLLYKTTNNQMTKQRISDELFSNVRTLQRDREDYVKYFDFYFAFTQTNDFMEEAAIAFLR